MSTRQRRIFLICSLVVIIGVIVYLEKRKTPGQVSEQNEIPSVVSRAEKETRFPKAQELQGIEGYINTDKISIGEHIGKNVVLIDFWTYSCINCQRTFPYLRAWHKTYKDRGLVIIGVHTPEFEFEKKYENVVRAVKNFDLQYPVVLDNNYWTWRAYKNQYWPRKYLIDIDGYVVYDHIGEGGYEETEKKIQELLQERMTVLGKITDISGDTAQPEGVVNVDAAKPRSPEIYFGAARNEYLINGSPLTQGIQTLLEPYGTVKNRLYLAGEWNIENEYAENVSVPASIVFRYEGKSVYMVASSEKPVRFQIGWNGKVIGAKKGKDVDDNGWVTVQEDRLYHIVEDNEYGEHTLELNIESVGLRVFTFTFG